jgi:hypothetical protein
VSVSPAAGLASAGADGSSPNAARCAKWKCSGVRCFRAFFGELNVEQAERACATYGAVLAYPRSAAENQIISSFVPYGRGLTMGLTDRERLGVWKRRGSGEYAGYAFKGRVRDWAYSNWAGGEPNDQGASERCSQMLDSGAWNDMNCMTPSAFVCEREFAPSCAFEARSSAPVTMQKGEVGTVALRTALSIPAFLQK